MHRLFVAIPPPREVRVQLLAAMGGVPGARWQSDEQLHLTLRFIGEVDRHAANDVAAVLRAISAPPFAIGLRGAGSFGTRGKADTLWIGIAPSAELTALKGKVEAALRRAGIAPEKRAFCPHVTVARLGRGAGGPIEPFMARAASVVSPPFAVESFGLYESHLGSEGAAYVVAEKYALRR